MRAKWLPSDRQRQSGASIFRAGRSWLVMWCFGTLMMGPVASALAFTSGSTGALGAFAPVSNTTVVLPPDGILNYTTVTIPSGVTVTFQPNSANTPVTLLAQGNITIGGQLYVNGANGLGATPAGSAVQLGGLGAQVDTEAVRADKKDWLIIAERQGRDRMQGAVVGLMPW